MKKLSLSLCSLMVVLALGACSGGNEAVKSDAVPAQQGNTAASAAPANTATAALSPEEQVEAREKNMKAIAKASKTLRAMAEGKEGFDDAKMKEAVALLDTHANQGWEYFDVATKDVKSEAQPAVWEQNDKFQQEIKTFQASVAELKTASAQGGLDAIKAPFAKVGESCKSCHTTFKQD
ncbi:cytochrome c [Vitreoscilla massiliensis]|uniref:Cytochrome c n=1 Tax=Vitreoscilla massiliensis TaxID=1689272 RepID=A0ABY4E4C4_9NEIS|nr:cytochrome c [Vitreoscilla massiliensis]UOO90154.1 cytochrome c [Vitreoscilla massiliensis]